MLCDWLVRNFNKLKRILIHPSPLNIPDIQHIKEYKCDCDQDSVEEKLKKTFVLEGDVGMDVARNIVGNKVLARFHVHNAELLKHFTYTIARTPKDFEDT